MSNFRSAGINARSCPLIFCNADRLDGWDILVEFNYRLNRRMIEMDLLRSLLSAYLGTQVKTIQ